MEDFLGCLVAFTLCSVNINRKRGIPQNVQKAFTFWKTVVIPNNKNVTSSSSLTPSRYCVILAPLVVLTLQKTDANLQKTLVTPGVSAYLASFFEVDLNDYVDNVSFLGG